MRAFVKAVRDGRSVELSAVPLEQLYCELRGRGFGVLPGGAWKDVCDEVARLRAELEKVQQEIRLWHVFANGALGRRQRAESEAEALAAVLAAPAIAELESGLERNQ